MIRCDVCDELLIIDGDLDSDSDEGIIVICPECGYDNSYQVVDEEGIYDDIDVFLDGNEVYDDEVLLIALAERLGGLSIDDLRSMIREREMLGWNVKVRRI